MQLEKSLAESASALQQAVDLSMRGTYAYQSIKTAAELTVNCLSNDPNRRPPMEDVVWHLQYSIQAQQTWTSSGNLAFNSGNQGLNKLCIYVHDRTDVVLLESGSVPAALNCVI